MDGPEISRSLGRFLFYFSWLLFVPLAVAVYYDYITASALPFPKSTNAFAFTFLIALILSRLFLYLGRNASGALRRKESIFVVILVWVLTTVIGALPFLFTNTLSNPIDAIFESVSGFTTTGATIFEPKQFAGNEEVPICLKVSNAPEICHSFYGTIDPLRDLSGQIVLTGIEAVSKPLLFWRSFMQWLGGMGIVVLFIAVLPALGMGGRFLFEAEAPGPDKEPMTPRIKETASFLWKIYLSLTVLQILLLSLTNSAMPIFDAICLSLSSISTGGFTVRSEGIAAYHSLSTEMIVMLFMILGSINFTLYFHCLRGKIYRVYEPEFFAFLATCAISVFFVTFILWDWGHSSFSFAESLRFGSFQAISAQTSTGFTTYNFNLWPGSVQLALVLLMFIGGMSGSTSGGIKIGRLLIIFRAAMHKIESIFRPDAIRSLKIGTKEISSKVATTALIYFCILIALVTLGTFFFVLEGIDVRVSFGMIASLINNAGMAPHSYAFLTPICKVVGIIWMLLGRLEIFVLLVLFIPNFWRR